MRDEDQKAVRAADAAIAAIKLAIETNPETATALHAAVMTYGGETVRRAFAESPAFIPWRDLQRSIGSVVELHWVAERALGISARFAELGEVTLAAEFNRFRTKIVERMQRLARPVHAHAHEIRTRDGRKLEPKDLT